MPSDQLHHTGILVADTDRAARFYLEALDGHWLFKPAINDTPGARDIYGGPPGTSFKFCYIGFRTGAIELIEFLDGKAPEFARRPPAGALPHFSMVVDDVPATVERVEEHGGRRLWEEPLDWGGAVVQYVADPDGNAIELFNVGLQEIVDRTIAMFPDSRP
jgi:catechol 2,3-dioxygenase-like lactoylglutathione lyase family enzyme